ncbi:MAG: hypothetical protein U0930_25360 [Pirellulales bacterium]
MRLDHGSYPGNNRKSNYNVCCHELEGLNMDPLVYAISLYLIALLLFAIDVFVPSGGILLFCSGILAIISVVFAFQSSVNAGLIMLMA